MIAATILGAFHVLNGEAITAIYGAALGFAGTGATAGTVAGQIVAGRTLVSTERVERLGTREGDREGDNGGK
jgi:hypothetical protein